MSDVVVTVPMRLWSEWVREGDLPGQDWCGQEYFFRLGGNPPSISPGERVYVVAFGRLRGYAPLLRVEENAWDFYLVRGGEAVAITIPQPIPGFRGYRYRWWRRGEEIPFPDWRTSGIRNGQEARNGG